MACPKRGTINPKYIKEMNLEEVVRSQMKSYDELEELLAKYLNEDFDNDSEDSEEEKPKKKNKKKKKTPSDI